MLGLIIRPEGDSAQLFRINVSYDYERWLIFSAIDRDNENTAVYIDKSQAELIYEYVGKWLNKNPAE